MREIGFRRFLPVLVSVSVLLLFLFGWISERRARRGCNVYVNEIPSVTVFAQEGPGVPDFSPLRECPHGLDLAAGVALVLIVPAAIAAAPLAFVAAQFSDTAGLVTVIALLALFVPALWYFVGRYIDRQLGWMPRPVKLLSRTRRRCLQGLLIVITVVLLLLFVTAFRVSGDQEEWRVVAVIFWGAMLEAGLWLRLRIPEQAPQPEG
jgi:hypothetical protein